jgi:hypothetical protein
LPVPPRRRHSTAGAIARVSLITEPNDGFVFFFRILQKLGQSRGATQEDYQRAGGEWIERAGVTGATLAGNSAHASDHIM